MAKFTNYARGMRGISLKDGETIWLEPGESVDLDKSKIAEPLPDLGTKQDAAPSDDEADALRARVAELEEQAGKQAAEITRLTADLEKATAPKK